MTGKILIAYTSRRGSTEEIARAIGKELEGAGYQEVVHGVQIDPAPVVGHQHVVRHQAVTRLLDVAAEGKRRGGNAPAAVRPRPALPKVWAQAPWDRREVNPCLLEELFGQLEIAVGHRPEVASCHGRPWLPLPVPDW